MRTLKILGLLLTYPQAELLEAMPEMRRVLKEEKWLPERSVKQVEVFMAELENADLLDAQEEYVALFDRTPSLSLHLFEHVHGESRERGQAIVDLSNLYAESGLFIQTKETPDYLPLFLEWLSVLPVDEAKENLDGAIDVIGIVGARLGERKSGYAAVFKALEHAANRKPDPAMVEKALEEASGAPFKPEDLDAVWEEQFAFELAGPGAGGCLKASDMLARMMEPNETEKGA